MDNFHVVQEQVRAIQTDLPPGFQRQLPHLAGGPFDGFPRVYGLAWAMVAHNDSCIEPDMLRRFLTAYQSVQPLTIGELWAVAIAIRIVLVENLRRLADGLVADQTARQQADDIAAGLLHTPPAAASDAAPDAASDASWRTARQALEHLPRPLQSAFAVQMLRCLREEDPAVAPALRWLDEALAGQGTTAEVIVAAEQQHEGASNVTIRNVITSMRLMSSIDWPDLVESVCPLDDILSQGEQFRSTRFSHPRTLPPRDRGNRAPLPACRMRRGAHGVAADGSGRGRRAV